MGKRTSRNFKRSEINHQIAVWLRSNRVKEKLRQQDLADILNISHQAVNKYEKGICKLSADTLLKLIMKLNWSIEEIVPEYSFTLKRHLLNTTNTNMGGEEYATKTTAHSGSLFGR